MKERLDITLAEKGVFPSREKAKAAIMAGVVYVDGNRADKPGTPVSSESKFFVKEDKCPYVSRGGLKLEKAIEAFELEIAGVTAMDIGASTGGFTDCLLKFGAMLVYTVDVGYGQLDWKLRNDSRVINMEKTNIRYLDTEAINTRFDIISIDVSFISLKLVFPVAARMLKGEGGIVCLIKPQFEAGRAQVGKKGIVRDKDIHKEVISNVIEYGKAEGLFPHGLTHSPLIEPRKNIEYLALLKKEENGGGFDMDYINSIVDHSFI